MLGKEVSTSTGRECTGTTFGLLARVSQIHWPVYDVKSDRLIARLYTIQYHAHV